MYCLKPRSTKPKGNYLKTFIGKTIRPNSFELQLPQIVLSSHFQAPGSAPNGDTSWYALPLAVPPSRHAALLALRHRMRGYSTCRKIYGVNIMCTSVR